MNPLVRSINSLRAQRVDRIYQMEQKPVFVKLDEYKNILTLIETLKAQVRASKETLSEIHRLKQEEDVELEIWQTVVKEIEGRMDFIDLTLTEPENM
jgi:hypothetical protein